MYKLPCGVVFFDLFDVAVICVYARVVFACACVLVLGVGGVRGVWGTQASVGLFN